MLKMVAVLARAQSATSLAMEARRRVLESEMIRSQTLKQDHQRVIAELATISAETRAREAQAEARQETNQELYNWPTAALPPSAAPVDDLVADHMQLRHAHSELQARCEMLEDEIARQAEDAQNARNDAAAALTEALAANDGGARNTDNGDAGAGAASPAGTDGTSTGPGASCNTAGGAGAAAGSALQTIASADAATDAVAGVNSRPATATARPSRPPSAKDMRQAAEADKAWADVEALLDATEADARRVELSPTPVQVAIGSLSLREMRGTFGSRGSSASSTRGQPQKQHRHRSHAASGGSFGRAPQASVVGDGGSRRGHNNPNHPVEAVATLDWSGDPEARRSKHGRGRKQTTQPPSHSALTFSDLLHREQHKQRRGGGGGGSALPRVGHR